MVSPQDLGLAAALRLLAPVDDVGLNHIEGPDRYTPQDVADALSDAFGREVKVEAIPRSAWEATFTQIGFSRSAAASYACMTARVVEGLMGMPDRPVRCATTLREYIRTFAAEQ
jgi:uncharacterized protein YbjT (DUF2867 family)